MNYLSYAVERQKLQKFIIVIKYLQFIFPLILFYGKTMLCYDLIQIIPYIEISVWIIGCTVFGGEGAIASYFIIRATEKKIEKLIKEEKKLNEPI